MKPKPNNNINLIWLSLFWLLIFVNPLNLLCQEKTDSLNIYIIVEDSLNSHSSKLDSLELSIKQLSINQDVISGFDEKIDTTINHKVEKLGKSNRIIDSINNYIPIKKIIQKKPDFESKINLKGFNEPIKDQNIDVPKVKELVLNKAESNIPTVKRNEFPKFKSEVLSNLPSKKEIDSLSLKSIETKAEELAKNNIKELQELDKMEASANQVRSQMDNLKWDKSKIKSSKNIAKVLSENVDAVQTGIEKMKDFKGKYSKVNLMNPKGPVLKEISKKPVKPWQFSLNFSSQIQNGLTIQLAPTVGYKLYEKLVGGIGISYQNKIVEANNSYAISPNQELSHRLFSQYNFYRNFFLHVEHELPYKQNIEHKESPWYNLVPQKSKGWLGLALQYKVYKDIKGQTQVLYNIIKPDLNSEELNRWTIRVNLIMK